ncbi:hypothetical protein [Seonamhaeicola marinus]|uniref:Uncharacterized protein n=1 Tax=Seonamhaeicola marinus TaxID=1912246 RepID=A0A5D0HFX3_9FLAO|nr:hypothetical protein [Seonamhaeicola marinus]TYA70176.1 hypothetical protein FUA24_23115 [Seonamhaeicola marinus]
MSISKIPIARIVMTNMIGRRFENPGKLILGLLILVFSFYGHTQPKEEIELPKGGKEIEFKHLTNLYSLYITKNQEVYNDGKKLQYFQDVGYTLQHQKNSIAPGVSFKTLIYADSKVYYSFIEKIKYQLAIDPRRVYFMTNDFYGFTGMYYRFTSYYNQEIAIEKITTLEEDIFNAENGEEFFVDIVNPWEFDFEKNLYEGKKKGVEKTLQEVKTEVIEVGKNKSINYKGAIINAGKLENLVTQNQIIFLKFAEGIYYEDYIYCIQEVKRIRTELRQKNKKGAYIIELSSKLINLLKENNIKL